MNKYFGDNSITLKYIQKIMKETYNDSISVTGEYYTHFDMNYGFAHYVAKYLDFMYPPLDKNVYNNIGEDNNIAGKDQIISICNYFLCDNRGNRLNYFPTLDDVKNNEESSINEIYDSIYNEYMRLVCVGVDREIKAQGIKIDPESNWEKTFIINNDLPLFTTIKSVSDPERMGDKWVVTYTYELNTNTIFHLFPWDKPKRICEIDDLVASYLLGKTIGPNSTAEEIYYAQQLLIQNRNIETFEKGVWCPKGKEGTIYDMTQTVSNYQMNHSQDVNSNNIFVTGYFDIFTEACVLREIGDDRNGILGL